MLTIIQGRPELLHLKQDMYNRIFKNLSIQIVNGRDLVTGLEQVERSEVGLLKSLAS